jgi:hypothetical protein
VVEVRIDRDKKGSVAQFSGSGHSGYAKKGEDVVCAAVSTLLQTAVVGLRGYLGLKLKTSKRKDGWLKVRIGKIDGDERRLADAVLETMVLGLKCIERDYAGYIKVIDRL